MLKLSDNAFRPLFLRTCDWALVDLGEGGEANEAGRQDRAIVLFRLVDRLLGQLKVRSLSLVIDLLLRYRTGGRRALLCLRARCLDRLPHSLCRR